MGLSPELRLMVSTAQAKYRDLARQADADQEPALLSGHESDDEEYQSSIRAELAWLGFQKATKRELRDIIMKAMERDPDA